MIIALSILTIISLLLICYQDVSEREVSLGLFIILAALLGSLHFLQGYTQVILYYALYNLMLISIIIIMLCAFSKWVFKKPFLNTSIGLGDLLFFGCLVFAYPTVSFIVLFSFSLVFASCLYIINRSKKVVKTVPLAGYMALFLALVHSITLCINPAVIYGQ